MQKVKLNFSFENIKKRLKELMQILNLIYRNYSDSETQILAISLTYFSLLALFPLVALILGITKGFGLDRLFIEKMFQLVPENEGMVLTILDIANKLLKTTEGSVLTGVGIVILITSVIKLLIMLEKTFNKIWHVNRNRSLPRRVIDCVALIFIGPIIFIVLIATNSFVIENVSNLFFKDAIVIGMFAKIVGLTFYILIFTLIFYLIPNTEVRVKPAIISGVLTATLCYILKILFLSLQSMITHYNAIYGSLALIPIFLIWIQYIWVTILLGAQVSFSIQSSSEFLYDEKIEVPIKLKKEISLLILSLMFKKFEKSEKPYSYVELSKKLGIESLFLKDILMELEKIGYVNEIVNTKNSENKYQIAINPEKFEVNSFIEKVENKNMEHYEDIFNNLQIDEAILLEIIREKINLQEEIFLVDLIKCSKENLKNF